jgi:methylmalonyl-CoA mutase
MNLLICSQINQPLEALFSEFKHTQFQDWKAQLLIDLKKDSVDNLLMTRIEELDVPVYLESENAPTSQSISSLRKAHHPEFASANDWEICVNIDTADLVKANKQALHALENGATAIRFTGHEISNQEELILVLRNILPDIARIHFDCGEASASLLFMYQDEIARRKLDPLCIQGSVSLDPLGDFAFQGSFAYSKEESMQLLSASVDFSSIHLPLFKTINVNASTWHNSGASAVQELALAISVMNEYFIELKSDKEKIARAMQVSMAAGSEYFLQIAKFRSMRILWHMLLEGHGLNADSFPLWISSETASRNKTLYDPHNNTLRATTEAMSAIIGGSDELTIHPHDMFYKIPDESSQRTALNIHHLLHDESNLDKVLDVASGSYVIEQMTSDLIDKAWKLFLTIEEKGGFVAALRVGFIQDQLVQSRAAIEKNIRTRKRSLVGVSTFADAKASVHVEIHSQRDPLSKLPEIRVVEPFREATVFESLRQAFTLEKSPSVFLAVFGDELKRNARAGFAAEFMAVGGFVSTTGEAQVALIDQLQSEAALKAQVIILCSDDDAYLQAVETLLKDGWPSVPVIIAGKPSNAQQLEELGIHDFIFIGCDVAAVLGNLSEEILH